MFILDHMMYCVVLCIYVYTCKVYKVLLILFFYDTHECISFFIYEIVIQAIKCVPSAMRIMKHPRQKETIINIEYKTKFQGDARDKYT